MELTDLKGNALKVYLKLLEGRDDQGMCSLSHRMLGRQLDLHRETVAHTLGQLERFGLIEGRDPGWSVSPQLLADYLQRCGWKNQPVDPPNGRKNQPPAPDSGRKNRPPFQDGGRKNQPLSPVDGRKNRPPDASISSPGRKNQPPTPVSGRKNQPLNASVPSPGRKNQPLDTPGGRKNQPPAPNPADPLTRARTSRSSSSEEDSICTAVPPSSSSLLPSSSPPGEGRGEEGGLGGENPEEQKREGKTSGGEEKNTPEETKENPEEGKKRKIPPSIYLSQMQSWWDVIWPDNLDKEIPWFGELWEEFGEEIPVQVFRQFAESGRTRADLTYPDRFQNYFRTCCRNAQQGTPPPPEQPSAPSASRLSSNGDGRRLAAAEPAPEPAVKALPEERSVPAPRRPSPKGNGHPRPSLPEGNGQHSAVAESSSEPASGTRGTPGRTDFSAEEVQLKENLVNHMATFWANQADTPHTRSSTHFLAPFRRERRRS